MNKVLVVTSSVLMLLGLVFSFLPHDIHNELLGSLLVDHSHEEGMEHGTHDVHELAGYGTILGGLILFVSGLLPYRAKKKAHY